MKHTIISMCLFLAAISINAQDQNAEAWRNDLNYLVQRIEIMHPSPYDFFSKEEFYKAKEKLHHEIPGLSDTDIVLSISELLVTLQDGHTRWAFANPQWLQQTFHFLPVIQYAFKDGIYIIAGLQQYENLVGSKVIQIGKMPINQVTSKLSAMWSHDNPSGEKKFLSYTLSIAEMLKRAGAVEDVSEIEMVLQNDNNEKVTVHLPTVDFSTLAPFIAGTCYPQTGNGLIAMNRRAENPIPLWLKNPGKKFWFEYIPEEKTMFLQINSLNFPHGNSNEESSFAQLCNQFFKTFDQSKAEKLVIDVRTNTGGNHVELPLLKGIIARPHIDKPDRLFLITGRVTFSAAVHLTTTLKRYTDITIIGEPASGRPNHYGAVRAFQLPNHPQIVIQCSIDYYQDSQPSDFNIINAPDIWAEMTASDYRNNIDPAMHAVKNFDSITRQVDELAKELEEVYNKKGIPGLKKTYYSGKSKIENNGYNLEKFLNEFYYYYLSENSKSKTDLIDYLDFSISECPESIDLNFIMGLQLESDRRIDEAKQKYKRCLELNPAHRYAKIKLALIGLSK